MSRLSSDHLRKNWLQLSASGCGFLAVLRLEDGHLLIQVRIQIVELASLVQFPISIPHESGWCPQLR